MDNPILGILAVVNTTLNHTDLPPYQKSEWHGLSSKLWIYLAPIIFVIGVIGNLLIIAVMRRKKFHGTTTCIYLLLMAIADLLVLIIGIIPEWLSANSIIVFKEIHPMSCKLEKFLQYTFGDISIWILMCFTVDRFVAVCFPFSKTNFCKPGRAKFYCLAVTILAVLKNACVFWTRGRVYELHRHDDGNITQEIDSNCGKPEPFTYFEEYIRPWIAFALISAVPFIVIIICNVMIIRALIESKEATAGNKIQSKRETTYKQMTMMCLSASFAFLLFITPSIVLLIGKPYWDNENDAYIIAKAINNQLTYVNHSINFFLYCISGARFRSELVRVVVCCVGHRPTTSSWETTDGNTHLYRYRITGSRASTPNSLRRDSNAKNGTIYKKLDFIQGGTLDRRIAELKRNESLA